ncbi:SprT family zinc-dependent metalloprotease [Kingella negevensis]|uniref:M48 family metallopeptidase n=1 Tax=Kingella negevensis TaxID=1522312 RepID=UPI0025433B84|nr:SprT family zinc-dependent metalloprotease [Kingella negevensis]WII92225.1 SprT family zinc-dependent metalloprotease [Kingella negevensis]
MNTMIYTVSGCAITLHIKRNTKKNIIVRPNDNRSLKIGIPNWFTQKDLLAWLDKNEAVLQRLLAKRAPEPAMSQPENVGFMGKTYALVSVPVSQIERDEANLVFRLPESLSQTQQFDLLREYFFQAAEKHLLAKLEYWIGQTKLKPVAIGLTNAKTFWGVCRPRTGIRINWRLIAAPEFVQDCVCVHELCHLKHTNHSAAFWALLRQEFPQMDSAEAWLKEQGKTLFVLG